MSVVRCVRLLESEGESLTRAARYTGLTVNDFIREAVMTKIDAARESFRAGVPPVPFAPRERRPNTRRRPIAFSLSETFFRALQRRVPQRIDRNDFLRAALKVEVDNQSTNIDPDAGRREFLFHVLLTDEEMNAVNAACARREMKRAVFARVAMWRAIHAPTTDSADRASLPSPETSLESRQAEGSDPSRPDTRP